MVLRIRFRSIKEVASAAEQNLVVESDRSAKLYVNVALNFVNQVRAAAAPPARCALSIFPSQGEAYLMESGASGAAARRRA